MIWALVVGVAVALLVVAYLGWTLYVQLTWKRWEPPDA